MSEVLPPPQTPSFAEASKPAESRPLAHTLVIGLGNPILGDDGFGWRVAEEVRKAVSGPHPWLLSLEGRGGEDAPGDLEIDCLALGGLALMERLVGYSRAIIVDAMYTGQKPPGSLSCFPLSALDNPTAGHSGSVHDVSLVQALALGRQMGAALPGEVTIVAVEAENVYDFSEELSPAVAAALPEAVNMVNKLLGVSR